MGSERVLKVFDDTKGHGSCRSCGRAIWWFELVSGKRHPFVTDVYLRTEHVDGRLVGHIAQSDSHFADCPQSQSWSRKK